MTYLPIMPDAYEESSVEKESHVHQLFISNQSRLDNQPWAFSNSIFCVVMFDFRND
jgi:hypothetical protein